PGHPGERGGRTADPRAGRTVRRTGRPHHAPVAKEHGAPGGAGRPSGRSAERRRRAETGNDGTLEEGNVKSTKKGKPGMSRAFIAGFAWRRTLAGPVCPPPACHTFSRTRVPS